MIPLEWTNINSLIQARLICRIEISEHGTQKEKVLILIKNGSREIIIKDDENIMIRRKGIKGNVLEHYIVVKKYKC